MHSVCTSFAVLISASPTHAGKVYNISPYMKFHPGGMDDLVKAAGKDSTILFDEVSLLYLIEYLSLAGGGIV